jgi:bacillithiol system protein YtxJ
VQARVTDVPPTYNLINLSEADYDMSWLPIRETQEWKTILENSNDYPQIVFKHSTRCNISALAKSRVEKMFSDKDHFYLLDLLQYRNISNTIASDLQITHESPQVLVIKNGHCVYHESHTAINYDDIIAACAAANRATGTR